FGALAYSVNSASMWIVLSVVFLSAIGLILLLLPRFTPRTPRWMEAFVPPRYRRRRAASAAGAPAAATGALRTEEAGDGGRAPGGHRRPLGTHGPVTDKVRIRLEHCQVVGDRWGSVGCSLGVRTRAITDRSAAISLEHASLDHVCDAEHAHRVKTASNSL